MYIAVIQDFHLDLHSRGIVIDRLHQATDQKLYNPGLVTFPGLEISHNGTSQLSERVRFRNDLLHS